MRTEAGIKPSAVNVALRRRLTGLPSLELWMGFGSMPPATVGAELTDAGPSSPWE